MPESGFRNIGDFVQRWWWQVLVGIAIPVAVPFLIWACTLVEAHLDLTAHVAQRVEDMATDLHDIKLVIIRKGLR